MVVPFLGSYLESYKGRSRAQDMIMLDYPGHGLGFTLGLRV